MEEYFNKQAELETTLCFRHPWFNLFYNYLIGILVIILFGSFVWWGLDIHTRNAREAGMREVYAAMDAEHEAMMAAAEEAQKKADEEAAALQIREAQAIARALFGIRNFTEKYHYTNADLLTYARCITNRSEATGKSVEDILSEPNQFIAYSSKNNLETGLYDLALQFVADWHAGNLPPCDVSFKYAVLRDTGIWLTDDPNRDVPSRWHA